MLFDRRQDSKQDAEYGYHQDTQARQFQGDRKAGENLVKDRLAAAVGISEVSMQDPQHVVPILDQKRFVQPQFLPQLLQRLRRRAGAQHNPGGICRGKIQDGENEKRNRQHDGDQNEDPFDHIFAQ